MLVKFKSAAGDIIMFGDVAQQVLKMMGQSGALPGALVAADVPAALERLKQGASTRAAGMPDARSTDDEEPKVSLRQRALPLIELLGRCVERKCDVIWEEDRPLFGRK